MRLDLATITEIRAYALEQAFQIHDRSGTCDLETVLKTALRIEKYLNGDDTVT